MFSLFDPFGSQKMQSFKWPIDKTVLHLNDENTKEKCEVDLSLKHLCFYLSHYHKNINSFGYLPYKPTTCIMKLKPPSQWEFSNLSFFGLVRRGHDSLIHSLVSPHVLFNVL